MNKCHLRNFVFYALMLTSVFSAGTNPQEELPTWIHNRIFSISSDAPIAKALENDEAVTSSSALVLDYISHVEKAILSQSASRDSPNPDNPLRACKANVKGWVNSVDVVLRSRGWPAPDTSCITELHGVRTSADEPRYTLDEVYDAVNTRAAALKAQTKRVTKGILSNWSNPDVNHNYPFNRLSQRCVVDEIAIVRVQDFWYLLTSFTNAPVDQHLDDFKRQILAEYLRVDQNGKFDDPLLMSLPIRPKKEGDVIRFASDSTTYLASWGRNRLPSNFIGTYPSENPAVLDALDGSDLNVQQADDAVTPSNIAILVLPLALNLVPISLLAEVSTCTMLVYVIMSDILTVIPLWIKGVELIIIGTARTRSVVVRMVSALNGTASDSSAGEIWASECRTRGHVVTTGIVFVALSITFIIVGVGAELAARHYVSRRRNKRIEHLLGQSGAPSSRYSSGRTSRSSYGSRSRGLQASGLDRRFEEGEGGTVERDRDV